LLLLVVKCKETEAIFWHWQAYSRKQRSTPTPEAESEFVSENTRAIRWR